MPCDGKWHACHGGLTIVDHCKHDSCGDHRLTLMLVLQAQSHLPARLKSATLVSGQHEEANCLSAVGNRVQQNQQDGNAGDIV